MSATNEREKRQSIIDACRSMNAQGINQGTSGNISLRHDSGLPITPTSVPYEAMRPEQIVFMGMDGAFDPAQRPSSEWRFHLDILKAAPRSTPWSTPIRPMRRSSPSWDWKSRRSTT